jgi:hypothetical protein
LQDDLHVLLRHRLLPHPGGFEGLTPIRENLGANQLAIPHGPNQGDRVVQRHATPSGRGVGATDDDDLVSRVDELPGIDAHVLIDIEHPSQRPSHLRAATRARLDGLRKLVPLEARRHQVLPDTEIASRPAFVHSAHDLDVLLRMLSSRLRGARGDAARGKRRTIAAVAVARQLAGFCWAIAKVS